ncbi:MAG: peptide chain release factor N(5)-glutamine methyltransferase [Chloroflexota bacterium]|nr:peptide chain release factor N(5)-glutamine methyltransferase [Chloroflexota bacterium]MDE3194372.1 peptide chain release factor N(5)-glutamine methyltransferase [Chloroflexota bacterium]
MLVRALADDSYGGGAISVVSDLTLGVDRDALVPHAHRARHTPAVITRADARIRATALLREARDDTAALDADLLLAHLCGVVKEQLYGHLDVALTPAEEAAYRELVARRARGEPVAYLRGYKEFFGLRLTVDRRALIPRPETEVLVESALAFIRRTGRALVADVGTGSGAIAIALAVTEPRVRVIATDVSAAALALARANAEAHGVAARVDLRQGDLLAPLDRAVDVVTANLPYLPDAMVERWSRERTSLAFEPREAVVAGPDGLDVIRRCLAQLPGKLAAGGAIFLECDPPQAEAVAALARGAVGGAVRVVPDLSGAPRVVVGERA